jgi:hypothetical protein
MCSCNGLNRRRFLGLLPGLAAMASLPACFDKGTGPAEIRWGKEYCAYCGMIIDDPRYAAQIRGGANRKLSKFDDLGDAVLWLAKQPFADDPATEFWVGDVEKSVWLDGRTAWYLSGRKSPMAHNFGAVPDARPGTISFADLKKVILERGSTSRCETPDQGST